ncbi:PstS family phosphate ABC transporter substrate-binding protein [Geomicrobium sp. JCM 19038]|uniref:PstS family phosphate ABC transporter substrate-binding protein n=1 Tax=Geomicrobium sp. JCM 19038 TaxID=1460635 RepID=UPI00045F32D8|nr:substrate-binding domain-containing protein [Geomicrobium sp. JCM 19038]GAK08732.1 phosphate ABC transporter, periplasmic phosphate-binding protein PstS [Geomicrobium sp. JCM 19038]
MGQLFTKIMAIIGILFLTFLVTVVGSIMLLVTGQALVYWYVLLGVMAFLFVLMISTYFDLFTSRIRWIGLGASLVIALAIVGIFEFNAYQTAQLETISDSEVDVSIYRPFDNNDRLATLEEESTLSLERNLPVLDGSTALYPVYAAFAEAVYPEATYDSHSSAVRMTNTPTAFDSLIYGDVDIIFTPAPSEQQRQTAEEQSVEFELTPIGREAFVFFVNQEQDVYSLTLEQIQDIYAGEVTNWNEVSAASGTIQAFQRPEGSGSQTALQRLMGDRALMEPPSEQLISGMGGILQETSDYRNHQNAIGFSFRYYVTEMNKTDGIRLLEVNDIEPSKENIAAGTYPITADFYAITRQGEETEEVHQLIEWMTGPEGQQLIEKTGYAPLVEGESKQ